MKKIVKIPLIILGSCFGAFAAVFAVYFFNLDMKLMAYVVDPLLQKVYNKRTPNFYV